MSTKRRLLAGAAITGGLLIASAAPAFAHVDVDPESAPQGGTVELKLRVPTERDDANTVKVDVKLPTDHPIASVSVQPKPGWTATVTKTQLAKPITTDDGTITEVASEIVWTADAGGGIKPGEFDDFAIDADTLPSDVTSISFPTIQTYSDGQEVAWIEDTPAGGAEPDHPVPVLALTPATDDTSTTATTSGSSAPSVSSEAAAGQTVDKDSSNNGLAIAALIVGGLALLTALVALARGRRGSSAA